MTIEHERIWLQNAADADEFEGRMWCQDKVWPDEPEEGEPTEYVRADLYHDLLSEIDRLREIERAAIVACESHDRASAKELSAGGTYFSIPAKELNDLTRDMSNLRRALNDRTSKEGDHG